MAKLLTYCAMFFIVLGGSFIAEMLYSVLITETLLFLQSFLVKMLYSSVICLFIYKEAVNSTLCHFLHFHR